MSQNQPVRNDSTGQAYEILTVCSCHVTYPLPECQQTLCSKQAQSLKFK